MNQKSKLFIVVFIILLVSPQVITNSALDTIQQIDKMQFHIAHPFEIHERLRDYYPTDEWRSCTPEEQGMNSSLLSGMLDYVNSSGWALDSIIIVREGYIVLEAYLTEFPMHHIHTLQSVTKSFTSTLVGIALQEGLFESVSDTIVDLFSGRDILNRDERKERMTVEHVLTMTSGVEWDEWTYPHNDTVNNSNTAMHVSDEAIDYFLNLPMAFEPGEEWVYNSGGSVLLGGLIEELSNYTLMEFARKFLFDPIGISNVLWVRTNSGYYHAGGGLYLKPRDMARLGLLYLNGGFWNGCQVVPLEWIYNSTQYHAIPWLGVRYGYQWWLNPDMKIYQALGRFGQRIMVSPAEDMVVVFTASIQGDDYHPHQELFLDYIRPAIIGPPRSVQQTNTTTPTNQTTPTTPSYMEASCAGLLFATGIFVAVILFVWKGRERFHSSH